MNAMVVWVLIQDVLHNLIFNPADVDFKLHDRLVCAVMDDMDVYNMKVEGVRVMINTEQDVKFFKCKVDSDAVLRELLADERLEGCHSKYYQLQAQRHYKQFHET
jgi:hypothetical protein